jgi:[ribosomal protein S5]-alanine N-acetyltransferase
MVVIRPPESFQTQRLSFRPVATSDVPAIFDYASDEEVTKFMNFVRHRTVGEAVAFVHRCIECWGPDGRFHG